VFEWAERTVTVPTAECSDGNFTMPAVMVQFR
jgi:hypothetical protein